MMANTVEADGQLTPEEQKRLTADMNRSLRLRKIRSLLLVAPLVIFILVTFVSPIASMLFRSIDNPQIIEYMPNTSAAVAEWDADSNQLPGEEVFAALVDDLVTGRKNHTIGKAATRLNYEKSGMRSLLTGSARKAARLKPPFKDKLIQINSDWGELDTWRVIKRESRPYTASYYIAAFDMETTPSGEIKFLPEQQQIYLKLFWRTVWMSLLITAMTLLLGYPVSYLLASLPMRIANMLMILVLLPFWTSLLVRTSSWIAMLQGEGVINDVLVWFGLVDDDNRLSMIYNATGTVITMTHILLPFMILPLYSVMKTIPPSYMRAARSLGATPFTAFYKVYLPQSVPGISAGAILVFILAIGYYITPALVGGQTGQFIGNMIAYHMQSSLNWGLAAALGVILLVLVLGLYAAYSRLLGTNNQMSLR
ncbi:putative spermidine/putrescine transport system permease protein [Amphritea atlantica]|uniref:Putative spermidine/putrescine transport system permease protein n=1 Tax=Amphritea atlantica TaxID=355243 RepID=A0A1H9GU67_9GAMM|nr:ABC transporter permease [Amphritea atlantica]SEQ53548.1 putative spermidine/putrescine transport system permease protein [Amphritea atlantica]